VGGVRGGGSDGGELAIGIFRFFVSFASAVGTDAKGISACGESLVFFAAAVAFLYSFTVSSFFQKTLFLLLDAL
jgi:hypothetical protein